MSSRLQVFFAMALTVAGETIQAGSLAAPVREVTLADGRTAIVDTLLIAAGATLRAWEWADTKGAELMAFTVLDDGGYLVVSHQSSSVTSEDNQTPDSNGPWNHKAMSCFAPEIFSTDRVYFNPTAATQVSTAAVMLASGSTEKGVLSAIDLTNNGATTIRVQRIVVQ